jgi:peptidoglycan/xylan/chitin deacetylase (PgdA/CDA1 family)
LPDIWFIGLRPARLERFLRTTLSAVPDALVLCYHAVSERWDAALSVTPERLEAQLGRLVDSGYRGATFSDVALGRTTGDVVAVTFDDAFASVATLGKPILDALGLPATIFAPTAFMTGGAPLRWPGIDHWDRTEHAAELACLDWAGLARLRDAGWEIGSHSHTHPHLTTLADAELRDELERSRGLVVQHLGVCDSVAYPYGDVDGRVVAAAAAAGYATGAGLPDRQHATRVLDWPRVGIYHRDSDARAARKAAPWMRGLQRTPVWPLLDRGRRLARVR